MSNRARIRVLFIFAAALLALSALIWRLNLQSRRNQGAVATVSPINEPGANLTPTPADEPSPSPTPLASLTPSDSPTSSATPAPGASQSVAMPSPANESSPSTSSFSSPSPLPQAGSLRLIIPVAGVRPEQLIDTFTAARSEGRQHDAIDIPAPQGTPVIAAADGQIIKLFLSKPGGITIYQLSTDQQMIYYYAHLDHYAEGLSEGHFAHQGEVIAYVGNTGNAGPGNYHLHFSISLVSDPTRYWEGTNINPYPLLKQH